jgi:hypothetical protein
VGDTACKRCGAAAAQEALIEGLCAPCVFSLADSQSSSTREEIRRKAEVVRAETAGLFPEEGLRSILEGLWDAAEAGADREVEVVRTMLEIQRAGGLGASRDMMAVAEGFRELSGKLKTALEDFAEAMEEEVRRKIRLLSKAGNRDT